MKLLGQLLQVNLVKLLQVNLVKLLEGTAAAVKLGETSAGQLGEVLEGTATPSVCSFSGISFCSSRRSTFQKLSKISMVSV